jgi:hypothetical protein
MERLSAYAPITNTTSSEKFRHLLGTTSSGTYGIDISKTWNKLYPNHPLILILSAAGEPYMDTNYSIEFEKPYLWVGKHEQGNHCALMFFNTNGIDLSHSQFIEGTTNYYLEHKTYSWMLTKSYYIYRVK